MRVLRSHALLREAPANVHSPPSSTFRKLLVGQAAALWAGAYIRRDEGPRTNGKRATGTLLRPPFPPSCIAMAVHEIDCTQGVTTANGTVSATVNG